VGLRTSTRSWKRCKPERWAKHSRQPQTGKHGPRPQPERGRTFCALSLGLLCWSKRRRTVRGNTREGGVGSCDTMKTLRERALYTCLRPIRKVRGNFQRILCLSGFGMIMEVATQPRRPTESTWPATDRTQCMKAETDCCTPDTGGWPK
jgi:hypothetical protein